jgi:hypothetical protein
VAFIPKIRHNRVMQDNLRLIFSGLWFPATGATFASLLLFVLTLGDYGEFLLYSAGAWIICTGVVILTSLNA